MRKKGDLTYLKKLHNIPTKNLLFMSDKKKFTFQKQVLFFAIFRCLIFTINLIRQCSQLNDFFDDFIYVFDYILVDTKCMLYTIKKMSS